ncbi:hypothetical protein HPP92_022305 [Vanilla planifolia]|uniref:Uncharacterized protein n=1 Tax=Vanilla planifolia TaxID=51239 RepID=A0A835Q0B0_VANPL|nr:hypothetical protein HPP92_022305 [Vanilla planifolia]
MQNCWKRFLSVRRAAVVIQSGMRGRLVRRYSGDSAFELLDGKKDAGTDQVHIKSSVLAELQRRILKAEATLREKEERTTSSTRESSSTSPGGPTTSRK